MILDEVEFINSTWPGFAHPVNWGTPSINLDSIGSVTISFHIWWVDVGITWHLARSDDGTAAPADWDDITAAYRAIDPLWVDPLVGDPATNHIVAMMNVGAKYINLGYTLGNWAGPAHYLKVVMYRTRGIVK